MRGLDTNVLLRYLAQDEPPFDALASQFLDEAEESGEALFLTTVALCEIVWTLKGRRYRRDRTAQAMVVEGLLNRKLLIVQDSDLVRAALEDFRRGRGDFADYMIGRQCRRSGCRDTVTFDETLTAGEGFTLLRSDLYPTGGRETHLVHEPD